MARADSQVSTVPTILDRLLDDEPTETRERPADRFQRVRELKRAVQRDLQALLNTRQEVLEEVPNDFAETRRSLVVYGLPDFSSLDLNSATDRTRVRRAVEQAIANFEPRLDRVRVSLEQSKAVRGLHFRIEAILLLDPAPEPVTFDAELQLATQKYNVQGQE